MRIIELIVGIFRNKNKVQIVRHPDPQRRVNSLAQMRPFRRAKAVQAVACVYDKALADRVDSARRLRVNAILGR